jgi:hypothetical protein
VDNNCKKRGDGKMIKYCPSIIVNTYPPSRHVSWIVKAHPDIIDASDYDFDQNFIKALMDIVEALPTRISTPVHFSSLSIPRYFLIELKSETDVEDVVGVKFDLAPTKWGYRSGYWHPKCQLEILKALRWLVSNKE